MRICHITINQIEFERRIHNQIETAKELGYKVLFVSLGKPGEKKCEKKNRILMKRIFSRFHEKGLLKFLSFNIKLFFYILFKPIQIIHCHDLWPLPAAAFASLLKNCSLVYDAHEYYGGLNIFNKRPARKNIWMIMEWLSIPLVNTLITVSEPLGELYRKRYPQLKKVDIIRNVPKFEEPKKSEKFVDSLFKNTVIFHGHFKPGRGLQNLVQAMKNLPDVKLILVGGGELKDTLYSLDSDLKLNNIEFVDYINQNELISHASMADIGIVLFESTSLNYSFALPNKFFEYAMAGLPILASNIETLKYYIEKYDVGKIVNPDNIEEISNTLKEMLSEEFNLKKWKSNCLQMAKECNWENESKKIVGIYDGCIL
jgi:glycosyltransferase involved in cell wall biosynthesis